MEAERRYTRGKVLGLAGLGVGAAVGGPLLRAESAWARTSSLKVGVLVPTGSHYPRLGENLLAGLELGLDQAEGLSSSLVVRHVAGGYEGAHSSARELLESGVDVVVAGITSLVAEQLEPLFRERRRPLLVANVGAHVVRPEQRSPYVLHNSLGDWRASFALGRWAGEHAARRALIVTNLADAGYDSIYAFRRGLATAGGQVVGTVVADAGQSESLPAQLRGLTEHPSVAYVLASGKHATELVRAYRASGLRAPLLASAFAVEDYMLPSLGPSARGIRSCASWATAVRHPELAGFRRRFGRRPDGFAVLGYESALLLAAASQRRGGLVDGLRRSPVAGLRGTLRVDPRTNTIITPLFMRKVRGLPGGARNVVVGRAHDVGAFPAALGPIAAETASGYINEYLCA